MRLPFCDYHISVILDSLNNNKPLDLVLSTYFRAHKSIGAHDRRTIGETIYQMVRWQSLIDHFCSSKKGIDRLNCYRNLSIDAAQIDPSIPEPARFGVTEYLYNRFQNTFGEKAKNLCRILNTVAPTTIRANTHLITPEGLMERWKNKFEMSRCKYAKAGIQFKKREPLFSLTEFKEGLFEMQDEGSQLIAELVDTKPGEHVLDYCSGSGGKTLAFAPLMHGKGQIYLHDKRPWVLREARQRLKRANIQNVQFVLPKKKVDWLLLDVPCSGTGTLRRNPDAKWKIDSSLVERLIQEQRKIVDDSLQFLKRGGKLIYATCSILPEENDFQVEYFLKKHPLVLEKKLSLLPQEGGMDGFFAAVFKNSDLI